MWVRVPPSAPEEKIAKAIFFMYIKRWDSKRNVPSLGWFKARLNAGKNSPVDYFCDASASGPTISTNDVSVRTNKTDRYKNQSEKNLVDFFVV